MATNFPASLDTLTNPTSTDSLVTVSHAGQHANANDAIEALHLGRGLSILDFSIILIYTSFDANIYRDIGFEVS